MAGKRSGKRIRARDEENLRLKMPGEETIPVEKMTNPLSRVGDPTVSVESLISTEWREVAHVTQNVSKRATATANARIIGSIEAPAEINIVKTIVEGDTVYAEVEKDCYFIVSRGSDVFATIERIPVRRRSNASMSIISTPSTSTPGFWDHGIEVDNEPKG